MTSATQSDATARLAQIFEDEAEFVWRLLRRLGVGAADAEDLTHEVFLTVWRKLESYDTSRPLRPWIAGIAVRICARFRRYARNRYEVLAESVVEHDLTAGAEEQLHAFRLLTEVMQPLDLERRAIFVMHDVEGWSMPELAEALEIPLNTGYSRLRLARKQVAEGIARLRQQGADL